MNKQDLDALANLYEEVYYPQDVEQLDEAPGGKARFWDSNMGRFVANTGRVAGDIRDTLYGDPSGSASRLARQRLGQRLTGRSVTEYPDQRAARIERAQNAAIAAADKAEKSSRTPVPGTQPADSRPPRPAAGSGSTPPPRPAASSTVLAKQKGVEGKLDKATGKFTAGAFSGAEKSRYASVAAQNAARSSASSTSTPKPPTPAIGKLGNTSFERRTPTSAELRAAQGARASGASPEKALQAAQKTNLPTTGPTPAVPDVKSAAADLQKFTPRDMSKYPLKPATGINNTKPTKTPTSGTGATMQKQSYEWSSAKTLRDIARAYQSVYEGKGDGNLANNYPPYDKVTRGDVIAGALGKDQKGGKKIKKVKEEIELVDEATAMAKRGYDETEIRNRIAKSTGGGEAADRATELENRPTYGRRGVNPTARQNLARKQRGDFRKTTSSDYGLRGYAHKSDDPAVKAKQAARGAQRGALTPREKKQLNREAYEAYEFVASYLLENNFASRIEDANVIINNMSEVWFNQIMEG